MRNNSFLYQAVKDLSGRYIESSPELGVVFFGNRTKDVRGYKDQDIQGPAAEIADLFREQDLQVIHERKTLTTLDVNTWADGLSGAFFGQKAPYYAANDPSKIVGVHMSYMYMGKNFLSSIHRLFGGKLPYKSLKMEALNVTVDDLTTKEQECLFYMLRGYRNVDIAKCIHVSPRTVEHYVNALKGKLQCNSKAQIIDYAIDAGLVDYLPKSILEKSCSIIIA